MPKFLPIELACQIAKAIQDPHGALGRRQKKGVTALAQLLGVSSPTVNQWLHLARPVPATQCVRIEQLTRGVVTRQMLRPNDWATYWPDLATDTRNQKLV
ncbi:Cro/CI family transcriptional regulator [Pusillimonas sp. T7-7]|uniref:transcriptional regulator n=1 Tax=Pusillimonas sp. (strain T7-7) TaxID=1007105 RepID=UPI0009FFF812|nr:Cro/CI family transcriptional regulator [Pusillimonas sp. T7-7]